MAAYSSGEFDPGIGNRPQPGGLAIFANQLWLMGCVDKDGKIRYTTLSLTDGDGKPLDIESGAATIQNSWNTEKFDNGKCFSRSALASCGDALFYFWNDSTQAILQRGQLLASRYAATGETALQWSSAITLTRSDGTTLEMPAGGDVSATVFQNVIVVAVVLGSGANQCIYGGTFRPQDLDLTHNKWAAHAEGTVTFAIVQQLTASDADLNTTMSSDWVSPTVTNGSPDFWLATFLWRHGHPDHPSAVAIRLDATGAPQTTGDYTTFQGGTFVDLPSSELPAGPVCVVRDPAGRTTIWANGGQTLSESIFLYEGALFGVSTGSTIATPTSNNGSPSVLYYTNPVSTTGTFQGKPTQEYGVYRFLFYGTDSVKGRVDRWGTAQAIVDAQVVTATPQSNKMMISGIFDAPLPYPDMNNKGYPFQDTQAVVGTVTYGEDSTKQTGHEVSRSILAGFQSSGETSKGFGPAWDISFKAGPASVSGDSVETSLGSEYSAPSKLDMKQKPPTTIPLGAALATTLSIKTTLYRLLDANGGVLSDATTGTTDSGAKYAQVDVTLTPGTEQQFRPYTVTPGNLATYTPEEIDATMKSRGYQGDSYFADEIVANAFVVDPTTKLNYLQASWGESGTSVQQFQQVTSSFAENSINIEGSAYVGAGWGGDIGFLGMTTFEDFSAQFLVGTDIDYSTQESSSTDASWGVTLDADFGPPVTLVNKNNLERVTNYTFRVYFLPPPPNDKTRWVCELATYLPSTPNPNELGSANIDTTVAAWRIVYVVTSISYVNSALPQYTYGGGL